MTHGLGRNPHFAGTQKPAAVAQNELNPVFGPVQDENGVVTPAGF